jgi:CDP-glucose 4,6-dehydratase
MVDYFDGIYRDKKILITGNTGFKGSWLTIWLLSLGAKVTGYSLYLPSEPSNFKVCKLEKKIKHIEGDVRDFDKMLQVFKQIKPEIVFHLAAQSIVRKSFKNPKTTFDTNIAGTVNILECIRNTTSVRSTVIITSDKCYKNQERIKGYEETDILGGEDPYSASKACAEIVAHSYIKSFFSEKVSSHISTARAGNVLGGGDWASDRIVPDCIRSFSNNEKAIIRNPDSVRPWQHVLEPLRGYLLLGAMLFNSPTLHAEAFNFAPKSKEDKTVREVVAKLAYYWGSAEWMIDKNKRFSEETNLLRLSCKKALNLLRWCSILSFNSTIKMTADWYNKYYKDKCNMFNFSLEQIDEYSKKALKQKAAWIRTMK